MTQYYITAPANVPHHKNDILLIEWVFIRTVAEIRVSRMNEKLLYVSKIPNPQDPNESCTVKIQKIIRLSEHPDYLNICMRSVSRDGNALGCIFAEHQTKEICLAAIQQYPKAFKYVGDQTKDLCYMAVKQWGQSLKFVKPAFLTRELCEIAVRQDGCVLVYVPPDLMTKELCEIAVRHHGLALEFVPREFKTYEICVAAVARNSRSIRFL